MMKWRLLLACEMTRAVCAGTMSERAELLVDVDVYDNQTVSPSHYGAPFYGPKEIEELFAKCRSNGVNFVTLNGDYRAQPPDLKKSRFPNGDAAFQILHRPHTEELCFGYPEVRRHKADLIKELLSYEGVTGVALKTHYQHNSIWDGNRHDYQDFLYNDME